MNPVHDVRSTWRCDLLRVFLSRDGDGDAHDGFHVCDVRGVHVDDRHSNDGDDGAHLSVVPLLLCNRSLLQNWRS